MDVPEGIELDLTQVKLVAREPWASWSWWVWTLSAGLCLGSVAVAFSLTPIVGAALGGLIFVFGPAIVMAVAIYVLNSSRMTQTLTLTPDELREEYHRWGRILYERAVPLDEITRVSVVNRELIIEAPVEDIVVDEINSSFDAMGWMEIRVRKAVRDRRRSARPEVEERIPPQALRQLLREPER